MKRYPQQKLRNVCLLGHGGNGKTSLAEAMLYLSKAVDRLGKVADGNTVCDFDAEEIKRKVSISTAVAPVEWRDCKINLIDTPGYFDFAGEAIQGARAADAAVVVVGSKSPETEVGTEKAVKLAAQHKLPRLFFINRMDEENADYDKVLASLKQSFGVSVCPVEIPVKDGDKVIGYVNLITMKLSGAKSLPDSMADEIAELKNGLHEALAETSEEMMEKYFSGEPFTENEMHDALRDGFSKGDLFPVFCGSAIDQGGVSCLLDLIVDIFPSPAERGAQTAQTLRDETVELKPEENGPAAALVFKTIADPFVGKMSFFKVLRGVVSSDAQLQNPRAGTTEKAGRLFVMRGKKQIEVDEIAAGDIGVVTKLASVSTGDTLCDPASPVILPDFEFPQPCLSMAILPKAKGDEEKISSGLHRLGEEDVTFTVQNNPETRQLIISGMGDTHLDVIVSKLKNKFGTSVELIPAKVPYRETIRKKVKVEGKHKKQSGGHGQYGHVWVEFEPCEEEELVFEEKVFGGAVPRNFFPAVEKGLRDAVKKGVLAGFPVVNVKATLVDGSYHPVDSSEMSFKLAASIAYKNGMAQASPVLLEPIGLLKVNIPDSIMGDVIGDINKRRGHVMGMDSGEEGLQEVTAEVPLSETGSYAVDLRSISRGRGSFSISFLRYQEAPPAIAQKVVEESKQAAEDGE